MFVRVMVDTQKCGDVSYGHLLSIDLLLEGVIIHVD